MQQVAGFPMGYEEMAICDLRMNPGSSGQVESALAHLIYRSRTCGDHSMENNRNNFLYINQKTCLQAAFFFSV
jgi:hypothetical protein